MKEYFAFMAQGVSYFIEYVKMQTGIFSPIVFFIFFLFILKILFVIGKRFLLKITSKTKNDFDNKIVEEVAGPLYYFLLFLGIYSTLKATDYSANYMQYIDKSFLSIAFFFGGVIVYRVINVFIKEYGEKIASKTKTDIDDHLFPFLESLVKIVVLVVVFLQILSVWNIRITPLLASAGIAGIAIALAAQETIRNLFGGVSLYIDKNLKVGDWIMLDGKKLKVLDVGVRSTKFLTLDNTLLIVPNSELASKFIENLSAPYDLRKKVKVTFGVGYGSDVNKVKRIVEKVVKKHPKVVKDSVSVWFLEMGDFSLNFLVVAEVEHLDDVFPVKCDLTQKIYETLQKEGIEIPFPTHTVYLKKGENDGR